MLGLKPKGQLHGKSLQETLLGSQLGNASIPLTNIEVAMSGNFHLAIATGLLKCDMYYITLSIHSSVISYHVLYIFVLIRPETERKENNSLLEIMYITLILVN